MHNHKTKAMWLIRPDGHSSYALAGTERGSQLFQEMSDTPQGFYLYEPDELTRGATTPMDMRAFTIVAVSAGPNKVKSFEKRVGKKIYIPRWEWEEIEALQRKSKTIDEETCRSRFDLYGGIPRYIMSPNDQGSAKVLTGIRDVLSYKDRDELKQGFYQTKNEDWRASSALFRHKVDECFEYGGLEAASDVIECASLTYQCQRRDWDFTDKIFFEGGLGNGFKFEKYAIDTFKLGGRFLYTVDDEEHVLDLSSFKIVTTERELKDGEMFVPPNQNYAGIDFLFRDRGRYYGANVTLNPNHTSPYGKLKHVFRRFKAKKSNFTFIWVLKEGGYIKTKRKPKEKYEHWVIRIRVKNPRVLRSCMIHYKEEILHRKLKPEEESVIDRGIQWGFSDNPLKRGI